MTRVLRTALYVSLIILTGCSSLAPLLSTPTPVAVSQSTATPRASLSPTPTIDSQMHILRIWLPPRFDPNADTPSAKLLLQRLQEFADDHPRIQVDIRIKSEEDILNTLVITSKAAPAAMPDLIALSYSDMQAAALAGFLHPLEGLTDIMKDPDWYGFARELGHVQNIEYGIPFASDALLFVYRPASFSEPPITWDLIVNSGNQMAFAVLDPQSRLILSLYLSAGGHLTNSEGMLSLDEDVLIRVLSLCQRARVTGTFPIAMRDFKTDKDVLSLYRAGNADLIVVRASNDIQAHSGEYIPLLGLENVPYSIGDGWVWALAGTTVDNQELTAELASYLVENEYMSAWTLASGYLPTRPQALDMWDDDVLKISMNDVLLSAYPIPSKDVLQTVGPILQGALVRVLNGEQVEVVARSVMENLK